MAEWIEAPNLRELAERVIARREDVSHVDPNEVLFLWELETKPKNQGMEVQARTWATKDKPFQFFTHHRFIIAFFEQHMGYMDDKQRAILMWHELKHIPALGDKLKPHTVNDFGSILREAGLNWQEADGETPDILADDYQAIKEERRDREAGALEDEEPEEEDE